MNYFGKFDAKVFDALGGHHPGAQLHSEALHATHVPADAIVVPDAQLLFGAEFKRTGVDLVLSGDGREYVVHDYFKGEKHAPLASPDGAHLTGDIVNALSGQVQLAQAAGNAGGGQVIGHVTKLVGNATAIRNGVSIILNNGDNVEKGDVVQSGSDSTLGITFIDGTVFGLSSNARMVLNEMVYDPNGSNNSSLLSLVAGTITFVAGETAKHGDMKVDTPVATMGIRGTAVLFAVHFKLPNGSFAADDMNPPPDAVPEGQFQVLVEPDGTTGSYILFDKLTLTPLTVVDKANVQWNVSNGLLNQTTTPLSPEILKLITDVFSLKFSDSSTTKSLDHFTDSIIPTPFGQTKFGFVNYTPPTFTFASLVGPTTGPTTFNGANVSHIAQAPNFTGIDNGKITELLDTTGSSTLDKVTGAFHYFDVNATSDHPTVSAKFASFTYQDAHGNDVTSKLNALELADIKAVENGLSVTQGTFNSVGDGTASWTYKIPDGAFDFLAKGETLTLTFNATVDNNYVPADQTGSGTFTITITGTNDAPVITSPQQNVNFVSAGTDTKGGELIPNTATSGTLAFSDPDLTDTHTVGVEMMSALLDGKPLSDTVGQNVINELAAAMTVKIAPGHDSTGVGFGSVDWTLADLEVYLADLVPAGETLVLTYEVTVTDSQGATSTKDIVVTIGGNLPPATVWIDTNPIPPGGVALWETASNWESDKVPTANDDVFIGTDQVLPGTPTFPATVDIASAAKSLTMDYFTDFGSAIPELDVVSTGTLTITKDLKLGTSTDPLAPSSGEVIVKNWGTISVGGEIDLLKHSVLDNYNTLILNGGGKFADQSSVTNSGTIELKTGTLDVAVDIANSNAGTGGIIQVDKTATLKLSNGATITKGSLNIAGGATVDVEAATPGTVAATLNDVTVNGTDAASPDAASLIEIGAAAAAILVLENGTKVENGALKVFGGSTLEIESAAGATLDGVSVIGNSSVPESMIEVGAGSTLVLEDGTIISDGKMTIADTGKLEVAAGTTGAGATIDNVTVSGGTILVDAGVTLTLDPVTLDSVTLKGNFINADTLTLNKVKLDGVTLDGGTDAATGVTVSADSTIENATVTGDLTNNDGVTLTLNTVKLEGVTLDGGTDAATGVTVSADSTIKDATVTGDLTNNDGVTLTLNTVKLDGVTISGGT
ncbi:MAG TPA: FecR domain-containing protein, partial [Bradyrhizobium sp.]|uniref:FecR domain-containing protein n=1 Tax=Bradyrhizobium sp. TaxID=376 RepID=UPI002D80528F